MQVCTSLQTDNHASTPPLSFYRLDALPVTRPTASKHEGTVKKINNHAENNNNYYYPHLTASFPGQPK